MSVRLFEYSGGGQIGHGKGRLARCLPGGIAAFHDPDDLRIAIGAEGNAFRELDGEETGAVCLALGVNAPEQVEALGAAFVVETIAAMRKAARLTSKPASPSEPDKGKGKPKPAGLTPIDRSEPV